MTIETFARMVLVAIIASLFSGIPVVLLSTGSMEGDTALSVATGLMSIAFAGNFLIGLPVALLLFHFVGRQESLSLIKLFLWANLAAALFVIALAATGGALGAFFFGIPIIIAANVFAIAGWFLVIKPLRAESQER